MKLVDVAQETGRQRNTVTLKYRETAQRIDPELRRYNQLCQLYPCEVGDSLDLGRIYLYCLTGLTPKADFPISLGDGLELTHSARSLNDGYIVNVDLLVL